MGLSHWSSHLALGTSQSGEGDRQQWTLPLCSAGWGRGDEFRAEGFPGNHFSQLGGPRAPESFPGDAVSHRTLKGQAE